MTENLANLKKSIINDFNIYMNSMKTRTLKHAGLDIITDKREGVYIWDITGKRFLDCITGAGSFNLGHRNPVIMKALANALETTDVGIFLLPSREKAELAKKLAEITPGDLKCTVYGTGGGEANDFAMKLARGYTMKQEIISTQKAYHGHTALSLTATGRDVYKKPFEPLIPGVKHIPFNDINAMENTINENTAAVILEPIQGEGGINIPDENYLPQVRKLCNKYEALLIFDEIQTGWARTGKMFCCEHYNTVPDIMTVAKSMGGGVYPISATIFKEEINDFLIMNPFIHFSTFGGSDTGCKVTMAVIDYIEKNNICEHVNKVGKRFSDGLNRLKKEFSGFLIDVRYKGLMMGLEFIEDSCGPRMSYQLAQRGVLAVYTGNEPKVMRLMPPLIITEDEVDFVLNTLEESIKALL